MKQALFILTLSITLFLAPHSPPATNLPVVEVARAGRHSSGHARRLVSVTAAGRRSTRRSPPFLAATGMAGRRPQRLQYFWTKKTPEIAAADLRTLIETYLTAWHK